MPALFQGKALLRSKGWDFLEISLDSYPQAKTAMLKLADRLTVPQIFFNDSHIGGASDLIAMEKSGELQRLYESMGTEEDTTNALLQLPAEPPVHASAPPLEEPEVVIGGKSFRYDQVVRVLQASLEIKDRTKLMRKHRNCFSGANLVDVLLSKFDLGRVRADAVAVGMALFNLHLFHHITDSAAFCDDEGTLFRLQAHATPLIMNRWRVWNDRVDDQHPVDVVIRCKSMLAKLTKKYMDEEGLVDYDAVAADDDFAKFEEATCEIQKIKMQDLKRDARVAFCINLYNMMIPHAFAKLGRPESTRARGAFFSNVSYDVGGDVYSFNDLENGILRGNKKPPYSIFKPISTGGSDRGALPSSKNASAGYTLR